MIWGANRSAGPLNWVQNNNGDSRSMNEICSELKTRIEKQIFIITSTF